MDICLDSSLNKAHRCERKAEDLERCYRFNEALDFILKGKDYLNEARKQVDEKKALESIDAQIQALEQKAKCIKQRKLLFEKNFATSNNKTKTEKSNNQINNSKNLNNNHNSSYNNTINNSNNDFKEEKKSNEINTESKNLNKMSNDSLMNTIYEVMNEHDSLISLLFQDREKLIDEEIAKQEIKQTRKENELPSVQSNELSSTQSNYSNGKKNPKDDKCIIEELRTNNQLLREYIEKLLNELNSLKCENQLLKDDLIKCKEEILLVPDLPPLEPPNLLY